MLQLVYISSAVGRIDVSAILAVSRRNNRRDGITGLLYADDKRFLQALEGPEAMVTAAFARISRDPGHRALVTLSRREVEGREFGEWAMAARTPGQDGEAFLDHVDALVSRVDPNVRATFEGFARIKRWV
ncbi:Sensors of blue-light using FAD [Sphingomonas gellani]|uniref:Sensors of blue-light using FAD n=1 Tax=Sphingomonas gellani TaxID=1166340 RepID=A0A1H7Y7R7_9SPHN|nr:BLUF domain-containing protein [Sphingomonas gellani]SEM41377.1 Sensors of blue-light using FAD [Sphingomonas gellani]